MVLSRSNFSRTITLVVDYRCDDKFYNVVSVRLCLKKTSANTIDTPLKLIRDTLEVRRQFTSGLSFLKS